MLLCARPKMLLPRPLRTQTATVALPWPPAPSISPPTQDPDRTEGPLSGHVSRTSWLLPATQNLPWLSMAFGGVSRKYLRPSRESSSCWVPQLTWEQSRKQEESLFALTPGMATPGPLGGGRGPWQLRLKQGSSFVLNSQWQDAQLRQLPWFPPRQGKVAGAGVSLLPAALGALPVH